jgi:GNAT superfamily N-acetyltransferase
MPLSSIIVRPLASPAECEMHFLQADQTFSPDPSPSNAMYWQRFVTSQPGYHPDQLRGAFRNGEQLGSYRIRSRMLRMGAAQLATGCIGSVVTYPVYRHQGVATALMYDAIDYAFSQHLALLLLAVDAAGHAEGYLSLQGDSDRSQAQELAADNWSAVLALLQYHARLLDGPIVPATLRYRLPSTAPLLQWIIDHLEAVDTSHWEHPSEGWVVRSQSYHHHDAGWMARLVRLSALAQAMLPEWQARWRRSLSHWLGDVPLIVGEETCVLRIDDTELRLVNQPVMSTDAVRLTPQAFTQIVFGYRPVDYFVNQEEQGIKSDLLSVLDVLFPSGHTWIPSSDWF